MLTDSARGNLRDAEPLVRKAPELNPSIPEARRNLALFLEEESRFAHAKMSPPAQ
jgi:hypothetical protein